MRLACILFFLVLYVVLPAQSNLSGTITDAYNDPLPFTTVEISAPGRMQQGFQADSLGHFSVTNLERGNYQLSISRIGYEVFNLDFNLQNDTFFTIRLRQINTSLNDVVLVGSKPAIEKLTDRIVYHISASVTAAGANALEAVGQIPGVRINNNEINIVGKGSTKVMINNRLIPLSGQDLTRYLRSISANELLSIEVITNPSARYEAEGNAGLINIITRHDKREGYSGNIQLAAKLYAPGQSSVYGIHTFGEMGGSGNISYNRGKWSSFASLNYIHDRHLEGFETDIFYPGKTWLQTDTGVYKNYNFNGVAGVDYKISSRAIIGASYLGGKNIYDGSDHVNNPIYNGSGKLDSTLRTYATYYPVALTNSVNLHADIRLDTSGKQLFFNADYFNYYRTDSSDFESNSYDGEGGYKPEGRTRYFDRNKQVINVYTVKADADWPTSFAKYAFGAKLSFITNYSNAFYYNKTDGDSLVYSTNLSNEFNYTENTQSVYGSMNKTLAKWKLQAGVRGELTQTKGYSYTLQQTTLYHYFRLYPSLLVNFQANQHDSYSIAIGKRINRPSFWNLNPFKSLFTAYSYGEGNPYLQPEYNTNFEISYSYKTILTSSLFFNITENGFNNVTLAYPDTNLVYTIPLNFIKTYRAGIAENITFRLFNWWESNQLLTFYHTSAYSNISNISNIDGFGFYLASNNTLFFNSNKTVAGAVNFWYQFPEIDHVGRSDRYYRLDIGVKAVVLSNKLDMAINLNDALRSSAPAVSTTVNGVRQKFTNFQINRYFQLSLSYRFGKGKATGSRSTGNEEERGRIH